MAETTKQPEDLMMQEISEEIDVITDYLLKLITHEEHMNHFVRGLQVVVKSIISVVDKRMHPQEKTIQEEKATSTEPSPTEVKGASIVEEQEDKDKYQSSEDEESKVSHPSFELMASLNFTLEDLEEAEEKLIKMDCRDHKVMAGQPSQKSCCLDFMYEFLFDFRQKLQQTCEEFMRIESLTVELFKERKALLELTCKANNIPEKAVKPKDDSLSTTTSDVGPINQKAESEDSAPSEMQSTYPKDMCQNSIPSGTGPAQKDVDANDDVPSETRATVPQKDEDKDATLTDTSAVSKKDNTKDNTFPVTDKSVKQPDVKDAPNITPLSEDTSASSTTTKSLGKEDSPQEVPVDEVYDYVTPTGMIRMFGTFSQEPKIPLPPASPHRISSAMCNLNLEQVNPVSPVTDTDDKNASTLTPPPPKDLSTSTSAERSPYDKKDNPEKIVDDEGGDFPSTVEMKKIVGSYFQDSKIFSSPPPLSPGNSPTVSCPVNVENES